MKFRDNLAWIMAMDELQGDIPDPSSFRPAECDDPTVSTARGAASGSVSEMKMRASSDVPASGTSARGSTRHGHGGGGAMSC
jgi:hypothetical protein